MMGSEGYHMTRIKERVVEMSSDINLTSIFLYLTVILHTPHEAMRLCGEFS